MIVTSQGLTAGARSTRRSAAGNISLASLCFLHRGPCRPCHAHVVPAHIFCAAPPLIERPAGSPRTAVPSPREPLLRIGWRNSHASRDRSPGASTLAQALSGRMLPGEGASGRPPSWILTIRNKFVRDIAFVLFCPGLLLDSHELHVVPPSLLLGEDASGWTAYQWLLSLDESLVDHWFLRKQKSGRLGAFLLACRQYLVACACAATIVALPGDHYALVVEYVLAHSPLFQPHRLRTSVQLILEHRVQQGEPVQIVRDGTGQASQVTCDSCSVAHEDGPKIRESQQVLEGAKGPMGASAGGLHRGATESKPHKLGGPLRGPAHGQNSLNQEANLRDDTVGSAGAALTLDDELSEDGMLALFDCDADIPPGVSEFGVLGPPSSSKAGLLQAPLQGPQNALSAEGGPNGHQGFRAMPSENGQECAPCPGAEDPSGEGKEKVPRNQKKQRWRKLQGHPEKVETVGEFDVLFQLPPDGPWGIPIEERGVRQAGVPNGVKGSGARSSTVAREEYALHSSGNIIVYHWELSVKFLLYVGPWEVFGLQREGGANEESARLRAHHSGVHLKTSAATAGREKDPGSSIGVVPGTDELYLMAKAETGGEVPSRHSSEGSFLSLFLGPHIGESLQNRKDRLVRQLALGQSGLGQRLLHTLYSTAIGTIPSGDNASASADSTVQESRPLKLSDRELPGTLGASTEEHAQGRVGGSDAHASSRSQAELRVAESDSAGAAHVSSGQRQASIASRDPVHVHGSALLQGYLFYEYSLYEHLMGRDVAPNNSALGSRPGAGSLWPHTLEDRAEMQPAAKEGTTGPKRLMYSRTAEVHVMHWKGWWTSDISSIALRGDKAASRWCLLPKLEWLSPVVISNQTDVQQRVLSAEQLIAVVGKIQEDASRTSCQRKARVLIAELVEKSYPSHPMGHFRGPLSVGEEVLWVEASRGFVVESSWPASKAYSAHGFRPLHISAGMGATDQ